MLCSAPSDFLTLSYREMKLGTCKTCIDSCCQSGVLRRVCEASRSLYSEVLIKQRILDLCPQTIAPEHLKNCTLLQSDLPFLQPFQPILSVL